LLKEYFSQMNFTQVHERLRLEIMRRIDRGVLTGTLLARQSGLQPSHISNFLHRRRKLSLSSVDRVLAAQQLSFEDLLPPGSLSSSGTQVSNHHAGIVPLVSQTTAIHTATVNARDTLDVIQLPAGILDQLRPGRSKVRREWQRFLAIRVTAAQAEPMAPILIPHAIIVLDRHYKSFTSYRPPRSSLYAIQEDNAMIFRYISFDAGRMIFRPYDVRYPLSLLELASHESLSNLIVGRICLIISEQ
jgi:hypothetical protein